MELNNKKMNNQDRKIFREAVEAKLAQCEFNPEKRFTLSAKEIDQLLFDYDKAGNKHFVYTGQGLCKIDLSKADFSKTMFDSKDMTDLSNTNINIVFNTTYFKNCIHNLSYTIENVNFSGVDLSKSIVAPSANEDEGKELEFNFRGCDLSNTGLKTTGNQFHFLNCNLSGIDLSYTKLVCRYLRSDKHIDMINGTEYSYGICVRNCNLSNTGARIIVEDKVLRADIQTGAHGTFHKTISVIVSEYLANQKLAKHLENCTVKGIDFDAAVKKCKRTGGMAGRKLKNVELEAAIDETIKKINSQIPKKVPKKTKGAKKLELTMPLEDDGNVNLPFEI